jgi:hypothetical protein
MWVRDSLLSMRKIEEMGRNEYRISMWERFRRLCGIQPELTEDVRRGCLTLFWCDKFESLAMDIDDFNVRVVVQIFPEA